MQLGLRKYLLSIFILVFSMQMQAGITGPSTMCFGELANYSFTPPTGLTVNTINWTFGDGGTSTILSPSHTYNSIGKFTIHVSVTFTNSTSGNDSLQVEVFGIPQAGFFYMKSSDTCF